jgi:hypothetical protein
MPGEGKPKRQTEKREIAGFPDAGLLESFPVASFLVVCDWIVAGLTFPDFPAFIEKSKPKSQSRVPFHGLELMFRKKSLNHCRLTIGISGQFLIGF